MGHLGQAQALARLVEAVAKHRDGLVAQQLDERLQVVQLLVRAHADAQAADGVDAVLPRHALDSGIAHHRQRRQSLAAAEIEAHQQQA